MRQIGVRDEAKLVGGFGVCGRPLCCNTFLTGFEPVSIKMAKKQEMVLNIGKLSGLCSRLMCCLRYEYDGDLGTISTDDVIPRGAEDAPVEVIEKKMSRGHHREKRSQADRPQTAAPVKAEPVVAPDKSPEIAATEPDAGSPPPANEGTSETQDAQQKDHKRHRRRRFKK